MNGADQDNSRRRQPVRLTRATAAPSPGRRLLAGLPAILVTVLGMGVSVTTAVRGGGSPDLLRRYERDASRALAIGDYATAHVCYERLLQSSPDNADYRAGLALTLNTPPGR